MDRRRCSAVSESLGEPLHATASRASAWLLVEQSGAWGARALTESPLDREVGTELERRTTELGIKALLVKPAGRDAPGRGRALTAWSAPGETRLEELELDGPRALLELDLEALARGGSVGGRRLDDPAYLVCTNGKRDACCASRGRPVAAAITARRPGATFECSHVGGHRFAANVICLPYGLWYGRVEPDDADRIVAATDRGEVVPERLRGRSSLPPEVQAADWFLREQERLLGIEAVSCGGVEQEAEDVAEVDLTASGRSWRVRVRRDEATEARPVSCGEEKLERPAVWSLVRIEPAG